jgi:DNA sulfur modification protein DndB
MSLNPTNGHIIAGVKLNEHLFIGRVKAAQLFQIAPDPRDTENKKKVDVSKSLQDLHIIREDVQRLFNGAKEKNVPSYADYIVDVHRGEDGITPPITLYSQALLEVDDLENGTAFAQVLWGQDLVAIDGETQLAARHEAANIDPATKQDFVPIYICHGKDVLWARQAFHDLNTLAIRPNAALSIAMDARDPITQVCRKVERQVPFFKDRVNKVRRQLRATDTHVVTITTLRGACVTMAKGINGVQFGARPVPIDETEVSAIEGAAVDWFKTLADTMGPALEDHVNKLAASPSVFAALGAIGHQLVAISDPVMRVAKCRQLAADTLSSVNWERGKAWEGIAGKFTPKGNFSIGGVKETAYAVYSALTDQSSLGYSRIRTRSAIAA